MPAKKGYYGEVEYLVGNIFDIEPCYIDSYGGEMLIQVWDDYIKAEEIQQISSGEIRGWPQADGRKLYTIKFPISNIFDGGI